MRKGFMPGMLRHLDLVGKPLCGGPAAGAFVVDQVRKTTCPCCLQVVEAFSAHAGLVNALPDGTAEWLLTQFLRAVKNKLETLTSNATKE